MKRKILFISDWPDNFENEIVLQKLLDKDYSDKYEWTVWSCKKKDNNNVRYRWLCYFKGALYAIRNRKKYDVIFIWQQMVAYIIFEIKRILPFKIPQVIVYTFIYNSDSIFRKYKKHMVGNALKYTDSLIWPSSEMATDVKNDFPEYSYKNYYTPTPVFDILDSSSKVDESLDDPKFRNGVFSAGKSERDFNIVIKAFRNTDVPVTIVCPDDYPITETEITSNIRILRFSAVSHKQYYALASQAFCILISLINEKSVCGGLIINYAMVNSKPIIATDSASVRDFIVDNENGLLFRTGLSDEIFHAYLKLKNDKKFTETIIIKAKETARLTSPDYFITKLLSVIDNMPDSDLKHKKA